MVARKLEEPRDYTIKNTLIPKWLLDKVNNNQFLKKNTHYTQRQRAPWMVSLSRMRYVPSRPFLPSSSSHLCLLIGPWYAGWSMFHIARARSDVSAQVTAVCSKDTWWKESSFMPPLRNYDTQWGSFRLRLKNTAHANPLMSHRKLVCVCAHLHTSRLVVKEVWTCQNQQVA